MGVEIDLFVCYNVSAIGGVPPIKYDNTEQKAPEEEPFL